MLLYKLSRPFLFLLQIDPANFEGLKSRLEQKDKEICALKQAAKVRHQYRHGCPNSDSHMIVRIRVPMSVALQYAVKASIFQKIILNFVLHVLYISPKYYRVSDNEMRLLKVLQ